MGNSCEYKVMVKGRKNNCYSIPYTLPTDYEDEADILKEIGTDDDFILVFSNTCEYSLTAEGNCCEDYNGDPINVPEDLDDIEEVFDEDFWRYNMAARSKMFDVEIWYNSVDTDEEMPLDSGHFLKGKFVDYSYPFELKFKGIDTIVEQSGPIYDLASTIYNANDSEVIQKLSIYLAGGKPVDIPVSFENFNKLIHQYCFDELMEISANEYNDAFDEIIENIIDD